MTLDAWQAALRRQFGREQRFALQNAGTNPLFSEFHVTNPQSRTTYRVAIRGSAPGRNFCACPDFATAALGTCKHIEFTLSRLERKPGARGALARGWTPPFSEVYLRYGARREVRLRLGTTAPDALKLKRLATGYFDTHGSLRPEAFGRFDAFVARAARLIPTSDATRTSSASWPRCAMRSGGHGSSTSSSPTERRVAPSSIFSACRCTHTSLHGRRGRRVEPPARVRRGPRGSALESRRPGAAHRAGARRCRIRRRDRRCRDGQDARDLHLKKDTQAQTHGQSACDRSAVRGC
jgi:hypothetical protein